MTKDEITLKWGTLKAWDLKTEAAKQALEKYFDDPVSMSAMAQTDTEHQKAAIIELIEVANCDEIYLDWDGKYVSKEEAKEYVLNYGK